MTNTGKIATGIIIGTVLGATLGLLFAPSKGTKTRTLIADKAKELGASAGKNYDKAKEMLGINNGKEKEMAMN